LSQTIDFGDSWFGIPCSQQYFNDITPLFNELEELRQNQMLWGEIYDKEERFYVLLFRSIHSRIE
jgi:hypothetical protein